MWSFLQPTRQSARLSYKKPQNTKHLDDLDQKNSHEEPVLLFHPFTYTDILWALVKIIALILLWIPIAAGIQYLSWRRDLQIKITAWSEELSLAHLGENQQTMEQKFLMSLKHDPRFILISPNLGSPSPQQVPGYHLTVRIPISLYNIQLTQLTFLLPIKKLLIETLKSLLFLVVSGIISGLGVFTESLRLLLRTLRKQNQMILSHLQFRKN